MSYVPGLLTSYAACALILFGSLPAQQPGAQQPQGGMASAGPHQAEFDSQHRPVTAGGFVKTGPIVFQDVAEAAGLTSFHHKAGTPEKRFILEAKGPGGVPFGL